MTAITDIAATLERMEREQKVRDESLRVAFTMLTNAMNRTNSVLDLIHKEATEARVSIGTVHDLLADLPGQIREALANVFEDSTDD